MSVNQNSVADGLQGRGCAESLLTRQPQFDRAYIEPQNA